MLQLGWKVYFLLLSLRILGWESEIDCLFANLRLEPRSSYFEASLSLKSCFGRLLLVQEVQLCCF